MHVVVVVVSLSGSFTCALGPLLSPLSTVSSTSSDKRARARIFASACSCAAKRLIDVDVHIVVVVVVGGTQKSRIHVKLLLQEGSKVRAMQKQRLDCKQTVLM